MLFFNAINSGSKYLLINSLQLKYLRSIVTETEDKKKNREPKIICRFRIQLIFL